MEEMFKMRKEYELVLLSVLINKTDNEIKQIDELLAEKIDWVEVGGLLLIHRLGGYFINGLNEEQILKLPKELNKNLQILVLGQKENQQNLTVYIQELYDKLEGQDIRYAGLKGIILGAELYKNGMRRSNDLDLLVYEEDLGKLDVLLRELGYIQSLRPGGRLIEATKKEKMIQRLNYHDLVPYVKEGTNGIVEVDINFLFDGKLNTIDKRVFELGTMIYSGEDYEFRGLNHLTNLAFFLVHFYREATEDIWVRSKRNLTIYKIIDIINYIRVYSGKINILEFVKVLEELNLLDKALFAFYTIQKFYNNQFVDGCVKAIENNYPEVKEKISQDKQLFFEYFNNSFMLWRNR